MCWTRQGMYSIFENIRFSKVLKWCLLKMWFNSMHFSLWTFPFPALHCKKSMRQFGTKSSTYISEYSGISSLKLKNSGIYNLRFAPSWIYSWIFRTDFLQWGIEMYSNYFLTILENLLSFDKSSALILCCWKLGLTFRCPYGQLF
jgi:hypothetical protein